MEKSQFTRCMNEHLKLNYCQKYQNTQIRVLIKENKKHSKGGKKRKSRAIKQAIYLVFTMMIVFLQFIIMDTESKACVRENNSYYTEHGEATRKFEREETIKDNEPNNEQHTLNTPEIQLDTQMVAENEKFEVTKLPTEAVERETELQTHETEAVVEESTEPLQEEYKPVKLTEYKISSDGPYNCFVYILSKDDIINIAKLVWAEARGEEYEGKVAVAAVVLNRYFSTDPIFDRDSILDIIEQSGQFASIADVTDGKLKNVPDCIRAVEDACRGWDPTREVFEEGALYFYNPKTVSGWQAEVREGIKVMVIGNHNFHFDFEKMK